MEHAIVLYCIIAVILYITPILKYDDDLSFQIECDIDVGQLPESERKTDIDQNRIKD